MTETARHAPDIIGGRALDAIDIYTLRACAETEFGRRKLAAVVIAAVAEEILREGAASALEGYAETMQAGPRISLADEIADLRAVAADIRSGEHPIQPAEEPAL